MTDQPTLFPNPVPSSPVHPDTASLLDLLAGDPIHAGDRQRIVAAIVDDAHAHDGLVSMNRVRVALTGDHGHLTVFPRLIGSVVHLLAQKRALVHADWIVNDDVRGGNRGKPARLWRLNPGREPLAEAS